MILIRNLKFIYSMHVTQSLYFTLKSLFNMSITIFFHQFTKITLMVNELWFKWNKPVFEHRILLFWTGIQIQLENIQKKMYNNILCIIILIRSCNNDTVYQQCNILDIILKKQTYFFWKTFSMRNIICVSTKQ